MIAVYVIIGIVVVLIIIFGVMYNSLVKLKQRAKEAWSDIGVQLKRRYDLIPNLVSTVKGYAKHEKTVFEDVTKARTAAMGAKGVEDTAQKENQFSGALKSLFAVAENYPELKANQNFLSLQSELTDTEDKIQAARRFYNGVVRDYNTRRRTFPINLFASMFGFAKDRTYFELDESQSAEAREPVDVQF
jgi:LemA protein